MVEQITQQQFNSVLQKNTMVVVDYFAEWCGPCKMMHSIYEEAANKYSNIKFVRVDVDDNLDLAASQNIQVVPTFVAYKNGQEVARTTGYNPPEQFNNFIETL